MVIVICQVLDEERNIRNFCEGYSFADKILLADGGSQDRTCFIAWEYPNVEIRDTSHLQVLTPDDPYHDFFTIEANQTNLLIEWAAEADWIIKDDCDSWPNSHLKKQAQQLLNDTKEDAIFVYHLYIWGANQYFPKMNKPGPGLWAWRPDKIEIIADEKDANRGGLRGVTHSGLLIDLPLARLHYFAPDEETVQMKMARKIAKGRQWIHPLKSIYAPPAPLPESLL